MNCTVIVLAKSGRKEVYYKAEECFFDGDTKQWVVVDCDGSYIYYPVVNLESIEVSKK